MTEQRSESDEPSGEEVRDVSRFLPGQGPGAPSWQPAMPADASPSENVSPTTLGLPPHESPAIRGTIRVAENATPPPGGVLFIIARPAGSRGGPPAAVKRIDGARFPLAYSLSKQDAMIAGRELSGEVDVTARLDADGNASTREAADLVGAFAGVTTTLLTKSVLVLRQLRTFC